MISRFMAVGLARDHPQLSQLVGQGQGLPVPFGQQGPSAMVAPVFQLSWRKRARSGAGTMKVRVAPS